MKILKTKKELRQWRQTLQAGNVSLGFVPTMGALHAGHISLVNISKAECDQTLVSIFVNPTQFGPQEDFDRYPRTLEADLKTLEAAKVDAVYIPTVEMIYPEGHQTTIHVEGLDQFLCGPLRPGHFQGVTTVVGILLQQTQPSWIYLGEKDFQQLQIIRKMVNDLSIPVQVKGCPIVREPDGLAMSSRNTYLKANQRQHALLLVQGLQWAVEEVRRGEQSVAKLVSTLQQRLHEPPVREVEYIEIVDRQSLKPLLQIEPQSQLCMAVRVGEVRLIDNIALSCSERLQGENL